MTKNKMIKCSSCDNEISSSAKICPKCGVKNKKPFYKKIWFWVIVCIILIAAFGTGGEEKGVTIDEDGNKIIEYQKVNLDDLIEEKDKNAAAAKDKYNNTYIEFSGKLSSIDSDLAYISVIPFSENYLFDSIHCSITSDEQRNIIKTLEKDQTITIRGKVTDVGEILGYFVDIKEVVTE